MTRTGLDASSCFILAIMTVSAALDRVGRHPRAIEESDEGSDRDNEGREPNEGPGDDQQHQRRDPPLGIAALGQRLTKRFGDRPSRQRVDKAATDIKRPAPLAIAQGRWLGRLEPMQLPRSKRG